MGRVFLLGLFLVYTSLFYYCYNNSVILIDNSTNLQNPSTSSNYMGCRTWSNGVCQQCSTGYYFDNLKVCRQIDPNCRQFNTQAAICEDCYTGYTVVDGQCRLSQTNNSTDTGCRTFGSNNKCTQCSQRWYLEQSGKCQRVDDNCRTWNNSGACLSCYNGYQINQGKCVLQQNNQSVNDPLCKTWNGTSCTECSYRAFLNRNSTCEQVDPNCNTWDKLNGACLSCYQGYTLQNNSCLASNDNNQTDPLCRRFDWDKKECVECSERSFKNRQGVCTQVSPLCKTFTQLTCTSCYPGYELRNSQCLLSNQNQNSNPQPSDPGCARWDWPNKKCLQCSTRYYFNRQGICAQVSTSCNTYNTTTGACLTCYSGYALNGTTCVLSSGNNNTNANTTNGNTITADPNCRKFDRQANRCLECSYRFYLGSNGRCTQVSDQCQTWNSTNGFCTSCYQGYQLAQGSCVQSTNTTNTSNNTNKQDPNCARYDQSQRTCIQCATRFYFNQNGVCTAVSPQCQTWDNNTGLCTSCYEGYTLSNGACTLTQQNPAQNEIPENCQSYNSQTNQCQSCQPNYCLTQDNKCSPKPQNCQTCEYRGGCARCNAGYQLSNGQCTQTTGSRCLQFQGNLCIQCQQNSFLFNGTCITFDQLRGILGQYWGNNNSGNPGQAQTFGTVGTPGETGQNDGAGQNSPST